MIIYGTRLFGKVDEAPSGLYVATQFFHINYLPLVPFKTWVVLGEDGNGWNGVPIPMSGKSVLVAWLRAALVLGAIGGLIGAFVLGMDDDMGAAVASGLVGAMAIAGYVVSKKVTKAGPQRERELLQLIGAQAAPAPAAVPGMVPPDRPLVR